MYVAMGFVPTLLALEASWRLAIKRGLVKRESVPGGHVVGIR